MFSPHNVLTRLSNTACYYSYDAFQKSYNAFVTMTFTPVSVTLVTTAASPSLCVLKWVLYYISDLA